MNYTCLKQNKDKINTICTVDLSDLGDGQTLGAHFGFATYFSGIIEECPNHSIFDNSMTTIKEYLLTVLTHEDIHNTRVLILDEIIPYYANNKGQIKCKGYSSENVKKVKESGNGMTFYSDYAVEKDSWCKYEYEDIEDYVNIYEIILSLKKKGVTHIAIDASR